MLEYGFSSIRIFLYKDTLREKGPYSEFFWSVFSTNAGKYGPEKLRIRKLFTSYSVCDSAFIRENTGYKNSNSDIIYAANEKD